MTQLHPGVMERGYLAATDSLDTCQACLLEGVRKIGYFRGEVRSKARFHVSVGQDTVLARLVCMRLVANAAAPSLHGEYEFCEELLGEFE